VRKISVFNSASKHHATKNKNNWIFVGKKNPMTTTAEGEKLNEPQQFFYDNDCGDNFNNPHVTVHIWLTRSQDVVS